MCLMEGAFVGKKIILTLHDMSWQGPGNLQNNFSPS